MTRRDLLTGALAKRWWLWAVPLALFVINVVVFGYYQVAYAGQVDQMQSQVQAEETELRRVVGQREALDALVTRARAGRDGIDALYETSFSTESARLTALIREVKGLAETAGLRRAESISYPAEDIEDYGLHKRSLVFTVQGSYDQLRRFVNLLELSETFVVLERINVNGASPNLTVNLNLSTLFSGRDRASRREDRPDRRRRRGSA